MDNLTITDNGTTTATTPPELPNELLKQRPVRKIEQHLPRLLSDLRRLKHGKPSKSSLNQSQLRVILDHYFSYLSKLFRIRGKLPLRRLRRGLKRPDGTLVYLYEDNRSSVVPSGEIGILLKIPLKDFGTHIRRFFEDLHRQVINIIQEQLRRFHQAEKEFIISYIRNRVSEYMFSTPYRKLTTEQRELVEQYAHKILQLENQLTGKELARLSEARKYALKQLKTFSPRLDLFYRIKDICEQALSLPRYEFPRLHEFVIRLGMLLLDYRRKPRRQKKRGWLIDKWINDIREYLNHPRIQFMNLVFDGLSNAGFYVSWLNKSQTALTSRPRPGAADGSLYIFHRLLLRAGITNVKRYLRTVKDIRFRNPLEGRSENSLPNRKSPYAKRPKIKSGTLYKVFDGGFTRVVQEDFEVVPSNRYEVVLRVETNLPLHIIADEQKKRLVWTLLLVLVSGILGDIRLPLRYLEDLLSYITYPQQAPSGQIFRIGLRVYIPPKLWFRIWRPDGMKKPPRWLSYDYYWLDPRAG